jgi:NADPH:quinone reductase-like Zn-dependent oxidoreductase
VPKPHPGPGEVLARVAASGIIFNELKWDSTYQTDAGEPRPAPIPGRDLCSVVQACATNSRVQWLYRMTVDESRFDVVLYFRREQWEEVT